MPAMRSALGMVALLASQAGLVEAQAGAAGGWRVGASAGGYVPRSSVIRTGEGSDTRLTAGPVFGLDLEYRMIRWVSLYAAGSAAFPAIELGSSMRADVLGPSRQVMLLGGTAGALLTIPGPSDQFQPIVRVGGGVKYYSFDLAGAQSHARFTGDFGIGFRGVGGGPLELGAEVRFLPSSFDQSKLPTRGIVPQKQRQSDWVLGLAFGLRL
jgi:hypothetical protein